MKPSIVDKTRLADLCAGCGACAGLAANQVSMAEDEAGFLRPVVSGEIDPQTEEKIGQVCPGASIDGDANATAGLENHVLWGPYVRVYKGFAENPLLRKQASSGGVLSAVLQFLLETGEIDFVVQTAANGSVPYANQTVRSTSADDVFEAAGSRYASSAPLVEIEKRLDDGRPFAFVGKPCDVAALRALSRHDARVDKYVPFMISFFCAGVPSHRGAQQILERMGVSGEELASFRYRGNGWPGYATARRCDGSEATMSYHDSWGKVLSKHLPLRCKICPDGTGGAADIVCADAWACDERGYPLFEEQDGISLVLARTAKGQDLLTAAQDARAISMQESDIEEIAAMQPGQLKRKRLVASRLAALKLLGKRIPKMDGFTLVKAARQVGLIGNGRSFLGTLRRGLTGKL
ncbi:MAG: Coenzyme F420 hydrogenase/dehydrogenase, beta subunit C-terminal domain [Pseudomonadota bacterium]